MAITKLAPKNIIKKSISYFSILWPINAQMYVSPMPLASNTICLICTSLIINDIPPVNDMAANASFARS